jgi:hypothetical protein
MRNSNHHAIVPLNLAFDFSQMGMVRDTKVNSLWYS